MLKFVLSVAFAAIATSSFAAEKSFDFSAVSVGQSPTGYVNSVTGQGKPGDWKIAEDAFPSTFQPLSPNAAAGTQKRHVLAQLSQDPTDEHFPIFIFDGEVFGDFKFTTKFKCVSGATEQMAGIAFRIQDEKNYYVIRASALGNSFRFYKFVNGQRSAPIGPEVQIPKNTWGEMSVECKGNEIHCLLNGKELIPALTDNTFKAGKIGFWTKSDSVSYFADARITYTPREPIVQKIIRDMMQRYPRIISLKVTGRDRNKDLRLLASTDEKDIGQAGGTAEADVIARDKIYCDKKKETIAVILPLRDRNGETIAALRVTLKPFPGQTENNAIARALPINKEISAQLQSGTDLWE